MITFYKSFRAIRKLYRRVAELEKQMSGMKWFEDNYEKLRLQRKSVVSLIMRARTIS